MRRPLLPCILFPYNRDKYKYCKNVHLDFLRYIPESSDLLLGTIKLEVDLLSKGKKVTDKFEADDMKKTVLSQLDAQVSILK